MPANPFHPEAGREAVTLVDLNRSGVPLLEVVSEPDLRTSAEAQAVLERLHQLVVYLGICDGNMEEGSLRCDANVSVRPRGQATLNPKTEIKNLNSFRNVGRALDWEIKRQGRILEEGGELEQETRLWDASGGRTRVMRSKEEAHDYRYFPDPDLLPLVVDGAWIDSVRSTLPEFPWDREQRFVEEFGLPLADAVVLTDSRVGADYFETVVGVCGDPRLSANWVYERGAPPGEGVSGGMGRCSRESGTTGPDDPHDPDRGHLGEDRQVGFHGDDGVREGSRNYRRRAGPLADRGCGGTGKGGRRSVDRESRSPWRTT